MLIIGWATLGFAQTWSEEASGVLVPQAGTITANGVGSPSVGWDPVDQRYVMFFETRTGAATADCAAGLWSIGIASSEDGISWDVWPDAVVEPTAGTPWRCVAAHPTAVYEDGTWHLWFKAEQGTNAGAPLCTVGQPGELAWGCGNYAGIAHAEVDVNLDDKTTEISTLEAEITTLESQSPPDDVFFDALNAFESDLYTNQSEFACADPAVTGLCAPCDTLTMVAGDDGNQYSHTQPLCQPFTFAIPASVSSASNAANHVITLSFTTTSGAPVVCEYRKNNGVYSLDSNPRNGANFITARCKTPAYEAGTVVSVDWSAGITMSNSTGPADPTAAVLLTNTAPQTFSGELLDSIDELQAVQGDIEVVYDLLPTFITNLGSVVSWLDLTQNLSDPEKAALSSDGDALLALASTLESDIASWLAQLADLYAQLDELLAYTPGVDVVSLLDQVGLKINKVFGFPAAMKAGSTWVLMFQDYPNIKRATSASPDGPFVVDATPAISKGTVAWANTEVFEPNPMCASGLFPYEIYFGGRTVTSGTFTQGGISDGVSQDTVTWLLNLATQAFGWTNVDEFRHFDVVRASDGQHRMWFTERVNGLLQVSLASTTAAYDDSLSTSRVCP